MINKINETDCVILPSYREGSSRILLETAALGKPSIATNVPGCNNIIIDSFNGFLCEPQNPKSLVNAIEKFINLDSKVVKTFGKNA